MENELYIFLSCVAYILIGLISFKAYGKFCGWYNGNGSVSGWLATHQGIPMDEGTDMFLQWFLWPVFIPIALIEITVKSCSEFYYRWYFRKQRVMTT